MSTFQIEASKLKGKIVIPSSKSHTLRALIFALMARGKSLIKTPLDSADVKAMIAAISAFGAKVDSTTGAIVVDGVASQLKSASDVIDAGNSGIVLRFISAIAATLNSYTIITGDASIRHLRPMNELLKALEQLGALAISARGDGFAPIVIRGGISKQIASLSGEDSQPVSALLIASAFFEKPTTIFVANPGEKPWIDMTLHWLKRVGVKWENQGYEKYIVYPCKTIDGFEESISGDWSSAAYPLAAALITDSELVLENVDRQDVQGDKKLVEILIQMGAKIEQTDKKLIVKRGGHLKGIRVDMNDCIDMITILPVVACFAEGATEIYNVAGARKKESDRLAAITSELKKMGAKIEEKADGLIIEPAKLKGAHMHSFADHRMALALSVAALAAKGNSLIEQVNCIDKTYPSFKTDLQSIGANIL